MIDDSAVRRPRRSGRPPEPAQSGRRWPAGGFAALLAALLAPLATGCGDAPGGPSVSAAEAAGAPPATVAAPPQAAAADAAPAVATPADEAPAPPADAPSRVDRVPVDTSALGVPLYPGSTVEGGGAARVTLASGTTMMVTLRSDDPAEAVSGYYRETMHALSAGREYADLGDPAGAGDGSATLVLADTHAGHVVQVQVAPAPGGSLIQIVGTRAVR